MVKRIVGMYFSPTGTTEKIVQELVEILAIKFECKKSYVDFTLPDVREKIQTFDKEDRLFSELRSMREEFQMFF